MKSQERAFPRALDEIREESFFFQSSSFVCSWSQSVPTISREAEQEHLQTWLGSSLVLFGAGRNESRHPDGGECSHKGFKPLIKMVILWLVPFSYLGTRKLKEELGDFLHLPAT